MSTPLVISVTDELVAELERECRTGAYDHAGMGHEESALFDRIGDVLLALMAERAELKRDAERLKWLISEQCIVESQNGMNGPAVYRLFWRHLGECQAEWYPFERAAIDAAMQSEGKP